LFKTFTSWAANAGTGVAVEQRLLGYDEVAPSEGMSVLKPRDLTSGIGLILSEAIVVVRPTQRTIVHRRSNRSVATHLVLEW
jgi:hypothetical protein